MIIFKNGFPFRGLLEFKRRKREYIFSGSKSYASIGKIRLTKDSPATDLTKGKVKYSTIMLKLHNVSQPFLPKVLYENSSRLRNPQTNVMANRFVKKEIRKIKSDYSSIIRCIPLCHRKSNSHFNLLCKNFDVISGTKNCKIRLTAFTNCRFYSQISLEELTFGELLSKRTNFDSSEKNYSLSSNIPFYMLRHSKYPTLAIYPKEIEEENTQTQNRDVSYYSFDSKKVNSPEMKKEDIVRKPVPSLSFQRKEAEISSANECRLSNDFIQYISVDKIPKNTLHLSTLYEQYFSSKIYFVKLNKIDTGSEIKIRKITRQLYPLNRKHIVLSDPVLKYLHFFKDYNNVYTVKGNADENVNRENQLYLYNTEERDHMNQKTGIREKPVPRDQLPPNDSHNSQSILNIINSIDRSEAIINKDLYITNKVVDLLKEGEKKKENQSGTDKKEKLEAKDSQVLSTNAVQHKTEQNDELASEIVKDQNEGVPCQSYGINAVENLVHNEVESKPIPTNDNEDLSNKYTISIIESEKEPNLIHNNIRDESCGINSEEKLSSGENNLLSTCTNHDLSENSELFTIETEKKIDYSKSCNFQGINPTNKLFSYDEAENNLIAAYCNEDSVKNSEFVTTKSAKEMRQTSSKPAESSGIYHVEKLMPQDIKGENLSLSNHINQYLTNKNELLTNLTTNKAASQIYFSKNSSPSEIIPVERLSSQNSSVDRETVSAIQEKNNTEHSERSITVIPLDKKIGNQTDTRSPTISHFTYPPSFVDNIVTNLRNPSHTRTSQATTCQSRGSHSKSGNEGDCTVDVLTETSITSTKFGERAKIQIHEVQTFKDRRLPLKFTTDTLMEMQGSNEKLRAATEVVEVAKAKLVLSRSNANADMKSGVENAIKLAELLSFLKHKVLVGSGIESKKIPIEIEPLHKEIKPIAKQTAPKTSGNLPDTKTTDLPITKNTINMAETNLASKPKQNNVILDKKTDKLVTPKTPATTTSNSTEKQPTTKSLELKDKLSESIQKADDSKVNKSLKKDKKPEDEVKVIKVRSQDLKKILRSDNTEHSIRIIEKLEYKTKEEDILKQKNQRKDRHNKHLVEKKDKKVRLASKLGKQNLKKIFDIKPLVKNATKKEAVERKTTETLQKNVNHDKKPEEVDLTARDLKIIEKIKKENEGNSNTTKNAAPIPSDGAQRKLENIKDENQDLSKSNKNILSINNAKLSTGPVTYDVIKIPGDDEIKTKFQKPPKKEKVVIIIPGEKETGEIKERYIEPVKTIKESDPETKKNESMEMVAVKEIKIKNDNEVLQSYKNVFIKKTHRKPEVERKSVAFIIQPIQPKATSSGKVEGKGADKSKNLSSTQKLDADKLSRKKLNDLKQSANERKKEIDKYIHYQKQFPAKVSKSLEKIPLDSRMPDVMAKDTKNIGSIKQHAQEVEKDLASEKKSAAKVSKFSEIKPPPVAKKPDVSNTDSKNIDSIKQSAQEVKKDLPSGKKSTVKVSKSSEKIPLVSKKSDVTAKDSKITGSIKQSAQDVKKDLDFEKKTAAKINKSSEIKPPVAKKPDVISTKDNKSIDSIKQSAQVVKKDSASETKSTIKVSKSSQKIPPVSKKPDVSARDRKNIGSIKQSAQEAKKDLASEKKSSAKVSKPSKKIPLVSKKSDVGAKGSKNTGSIKQSVQEVKKDLASEKKATIKVSKSSERNRPVSKKQDVSAKDSKNTGSIKQSVQEVKKDLASEKKSTIKVSKSSERKPPVSKKPDVGVKDSKNTGGIKQSAQEVKHNLASEKKSTAKVSKSLEKLPPVSKKPDVSAKGSKNTGSIKQSAQEVRKDLASEKKSTVKVSKSSEKIPPVSKKPDVSAKGSKNTGSINQSAEEVKKDLASEKKSTVKVSKSSEKIPPVSKKPDVSAKGSKNTGAIKQSAQEVKNDLASDKKSTVNGSKSLEKIPPVSKKPDVSAKDSKNTGSIKKSAQEVKKDLASDKKSSVKVSKSSEKIPPVSIKPDVSAKDSKNTGSIKQSAQEVKNDLGSKKETTVKVSKSSKKVPPVSNKPDVSAKDSKNIGSFKQSAKEVKKDLVSEKKSTVKVSKSSEKISPVSKKADISAIDGKNTGSIEQSAEEEKKDRNKNLLPEKKPVVKDSKPLVTKKPDVKALKNEYVTEQGIAKEAKVKSGVTLDKQSQNPEQRADTKSESPKISKFESKPTSDGTNVLSMPESKDISPDSIKKTIPDYTSSVISAPTVPTSFAKTKTISLSEDIYIDLDKLSKETKPALDVRGAKRSLVSLDKLMEFPLLNVHKTLYERPKDGIICVDCKKDLVLRHKLKIFPSVTRVLNATMSDSSRIALARWRSKMIADLGEAGFQEFYKGQIESGADFHEKVQRHFSGHVQDLVNSPNPALRSISNISKHISEVSVVESHVVHNKLAYRGIIDCVAKYNNKPVLIEWKRSDKKKRLIQNTFDAPLQLCAYIGALNFDTNYNLQVQGGIVVVAYSDGTPADVFTVSLDECQKYWKQWLGRLRQYMLDEYGKS